MIVEVDDQVIENVKVKESEESSVTVEEEREEEVL